MRHAAAKLEPLSRCGGFDSGRQHRPRPTGPHLLGAELPKLVQLQTSRYAGARLETVARQRARAIPSRRKGLSLALVVAFWRRPEGPTLPALGSRRAPGQPIGHASPA